MNQIQRAAPTQFWFMLLAFSVVWLSFGRNSCGAVPQQDAKKTTSGEVVTCQGILKIIDSVQLPSERAGVLAEVLVREGEMVKKGQVVARLKSDDFEVRRERARIDGEIARLSSENDVDTRYAEKLLEVSKAELSRSHAANRRIVNSVPLARLEQQQLEIHRNELQLEQAKRDFRIAKMQVELANKDMELSEIALAKSQVMAPIEGMVVAVETKPGEWLEPGQTILKIVRMNRLKLEGFVSVEEANRIKVGDQVKATIEGVATDREYFPGVVVYKSPEANPVNSAVQVWVEIENHESKLISGLAGRMQILVSNE